MKSFLVVFVICIAAAAAQVTDEQKAKLREYKNACIAETGVAAEVVNKIKAGEAVAFDDKVNCFAACMLKKTAIMRPDGSIDEQVARAKVPKDVPQEKVDQVINLCKAEVGKDICETGGKILGCLAKTKAISLIQ